MFLGLTNNIHEQNRIAMKKRIGIVTSVFLVALALPFILYALFYFKVIHSKSPFSSDIQEPVAKVVTQTGSGTAFLINETTLLTARHVVAQLKIGDEVDLIFENTKNKFQTKAKVKFIAATTDSAVNGSVPIEYFLSDVAVLEVQKITDITPLVLGESDGVANLDEVVLIGYPGGDYSITKGSINSTSYQGFNLFKLDAASNPGNSGGPCILKNDNTVIGILVGGNSTAHQGENVALKISDVKKLLGTAKIAL